MRNLRIQVRPWHTWRRYRAFVPAVLAGLVGVAVSVLAWNAVTAREGRLAELEFSSRARAHAAIVQNGINEYISRIVAVRAFLEASQFVDRHEFEVFTRRLLSEHKAILRATWLPRVRSSERESHELQIRDNGVPQYRIHDYGGDSAYRLDREEYFPVAYTSDAHKSPQILGLDVASEPMRRATLERARDAGEVATSPGIVLNTARGDRHGFFVAFPVYRRDTPLETVQQRREALIGFVNAVFQTEEMIETILSGTTTAGGLDLQFFGQSTRPPNPPFYVHFSRENSTSKPQAQPARVHWSASIQVGDRQWLLVAVPNEIGPSISGIGRARSVLLGGLIITALVVWQMVAAALHNRRLQQARRELQTQNARFDAALNNMSEGLCMFDRDRRLLVSNARYATMYGLGPRDLQSGLTFNQVCEASIRRDYDGAETFEEYARGLLSIVAEPRPTTRIQALTDGRVIALKYQPMRDGGFVVTHEDVTEQRRIQEQMAHMAHHDALTGLANRTRLRQSLDLVLTEIRQQPSVAVLCLDLDRFKEVNDTLGHPAGDVLLQSVAQRLRACVRDTDMVARLGGDEFAIVQIGEAQPMDATALAARVIDVVSAPYSIDDQQVVIGTSIGIAVAPGDGGTSDQLLKSADLALYRAKSEGRGVHRFFEREMDELVRARRNLENDLRQALANDEFELHYQPVIDVKRKEVIAFEALLRWNNAERGLVSPADFIPMTEETGLIVPIGNWVLRQACADAINWPTNIRVAVNLSSVQFKCTTLVDTVSNALCRSALASDRLELEITETVLLNDSARTVAMLHALRNLGVRVCMDDFGTGYSSLSYLQSFPFDKIKIDQSFIRNINQNSQSRAIVHAVAGLGVSLGVSTTAEGVETQEQFELVRAEGLTQVQGFYFSEPMRAQDIATFLSTFASAPGIRDRSQSCRTHLTKIGVPNATHRQELTEQDRVRA